jgi:hypothetical protein
MSIIRYLSLIILVSCESRKEAYRLQREGMRTFRARRCYIIQSHKRMGTVMCTVTGNTIYFPITDTMAEEGEIVDHIQRQVVRYNGCKMQ